VRLTPRPELDRRLTLLRTSLVEQALDGALVSQNVDLYYFSGTMQTSQLLVPAAGEPVLMVRRSLERARSESALAQVVPLAGLRELPSLIAVHLGGGRRRIGLEMDVLPVGTYLVLQRLLPEAEFVDVSPAIRAIRAIKSPYEVAIQREAGVRMDRIFAAIPALLQPGMPEIELAGTIEAEARRLGHPGFVRMRLFNQEIFYGHVLSGESGAVPSFTDSPTGGTGMGPAMPQGAGEKKIAPAEPVFVDLVNVVDGLMVDQTRVFALGSLPRDLLDAHRAMLAVQSEVAAAAVPGARCGDLYVLAQRVAEDLGLAEHFMGTEASRAQFIGHGVGLELNELPVLANGNAAVLCPGHVIALEPKCLFPGRGAVGIENTWLVTSGAPERLTITPDDLTIL
jgi:Xaa-Pro aminopeptidase